MSEMPIKNMQMIMFYRLCQNTLIKIIVQFYSSTRGKFSLLEEFSISS